jgi:hypothetical protein
MPPAPWPSGFRPHRAGFGDRPIRAGAGGTLAQAEGERLAAGMPDEKGNNFNYNWTPCT